MSEATITLDSREEAILLFGSRDAHLKEIRNILGTLQLVGRGDQIMIKGTDEQLANAERVFSQLRQMLRSQGTLSNEDVRTVLEVVTGSGTRLGPVGVLPLQFLITQPGFLQPPNDRPLRNVQSKYLRDNHLQATRSPEIGFKPEIRGGPQHQLTPPLTRQLQRSRTATSRLTLQAWLAAAITKPHEPTIKRSPLNAECISDLNLGHAIKYGLHGADPNRVCRINCFLHSVSCITSADASQENVAHFLTGPIEKIFDPTKGWISLEK